MKSTKSEKQKTTNRKIALFGGALMAFALVGCVDQEYYGGNGGNNGNLPAVENFFDYATEKDVTLTVKYSSTTGKVPFEVFTQDPMKKYQVDESKADYSMVRNLEVRPVAAGVTDENGNYSKSIKLPTSIEKIYIYTNTIGTQQSFEVTVAGSAATANIGAQNRLLAKRAAGDLTTNPFTTQPASDKYSYLYGDGRWYQNGAPAESYLFKVTPEIIEAANMLRNNSVAGDPKSPGPSKTAYFLNKYLLDKDFSVASDGEVVLNVLSTQCAWPSNLAYYVYEEGDINPNDPNSFAALENLQKYIILPLARAQDAEFPCPKPLTGISTSDEVTTVKLINPANKDNNETKYQFKTGTKIGFALIIAEGQTYAYNPEVIPTEKINYSTAIKGHNALTVAENPTYDWDRTYSTPLPTGACQMAVSMSVDGVKDANNKNVFYEVFGFEHDRWGYWLDFDFDDVIFGLSNIRGTREPIDELPPAQISKKGLLLYEDLWPNKGDYDMNDLAVHYDFTHYIDSENSLLIKTDYHFTLLWSGASFHNSFEIKLPGTAESIEDLCSKFAGYEEGVLASEAKNLSDGEKTNLVFKLDNLNMNPGSNATEGRIVQICKDVYDLFRIISGPAIQGIDKADYKFTVTYKANTPSSDADYFNPYINAKANTGSDSREVHLIGWEPTVLNNGTALFETLFDRSHTLQSDGKTYWYASSNYLPFAINVVDPGDNSVMELDFYKTNEGIFISTTFPDFIKWAGKEPGYEEWWKNYDPDAR